MTARRHDGQQHPAAQAVVGDPVDVGDCVIDVVEEDLADARAPFRRTGAPVDQPAVVCAIGDIDLLGLLGLDPGVRNGYSGIEVGITIEGGGDTEALRGVVERSIARSAVYDVLTNGTPVAVDVAVA